MAATRQRVSAVHDLGLRDAFAEALEQNLRESAGTRLSFMRWALRVPEPKRPLDFDKFPFQRELYHEGYDEHEAVIMKATQVGVSAWALRWLLYHVDLRGFTGLYVLPTRDDVFDFSDARIKPVIENSPYLMERVLPDDPQNKGLKKVGRGLAYFRGSESKRRLDTADVDVLVLDEYDTLSAENIPDAERRLTATTSANLLRRVGVPSVPGWGIAKLYEESDQRRWMVKCDACGEWQDLDFFKNLDQTTATVVCRSCTKPLDVAKGEWVASFPDRSVRGYHVTRLVAPGANLESVVAASRRRLPHEIQTFWNKDLGLGFAPSEGRLSKEVLAAAQREFTQAPGYVGGNLVTMGVDVASTRALNVRISVHVDEHHRHGICIREVDNFDELSLLMDRYAVNLAVVDHLPEGRLARAFAERFPGRVYVAAYTSPAHPTDGKVVNVDEDMRFVTVRRVEAMDATAEAFRRQMNLLPLDLPHGYVEAMQAPVRVVEEDKLGRKVVSYKSMGQDDWYHAEVYDLLASEVWWYRQIRQDQERETFQSLDDMLEFQRHDLSFGSDEDEYRPGGREEAAEG